MFRQILKLIPCTDFKRIIKQTKAEHRSKKLSSWSQFLAMLFCQLRRVRSLREIEGGLMSCEGKLAHLGIGTPAHSSLSYANPHRPWKRCCNPGQRESFLRILANRYRRPI